MATKGLPMTHPNGAAIYGVPWIPSTNTPVMLAYIYIYIHQHHGFVMGIYIYMFFLNVCRLYIYMICVCVCVILCAGLDVPNDQQVETPWVHQNHPSLARKPSMVCWLGKLQKTNPQKNQKSLVDFKACIPGVSLVYPWCIPGVSL